LNIKINYNDCINCGMCVKFFPENVGYDDKEKPQVIRKYVDPEQKEEVESLLNACPSGALAVER
jgi:ferredoxin